MEKLLRPTVTSFPENAGVKDDSGLVWGCVLQPFASQGAALDPVLQPPLPVETIARCEHCFAYINPYCHVDFKAWHCSLCGTVNDRAAMGIRYTSTLARASSLIELQVSDRGGEGAHPTRADTRASQRARR